MTQQDAQRPGELTSTREPQGAARRPASKQANNMDAFRTLESNVRNYSRSFPVVFTRGSGARLWDENGRSYIDFLSGAGTLNYGHNNPLLKGALLEYLAEDGVTHSLDMATRAKRDFIESFDEIILQPRGLSYRLQFTGPTGAHAVEAALRIAQKTTGRTGFLAFSNGFHGVTQGALSVTAHRYYRESVRRADVAFMPYDSYAGSESIAYIDRCLSDPGSGVDLPAAFIVETVQGEGGVNVASASWLEQIAAMARRHGALLIVDDIQVGCGRTGTFFSFERAGIVPDIVTLSKSLSGFGLPMALALFRPELDVWKAGEHSGTFRGNNLAFVTARATLEHYWRDASLSRDVGTKSIALRERLDSIAQEVNATGRTVPRLAVRGCGLIQGLDFGDGKNASTVAREAFASGLIIETCGSQDQVVKVLPPLTIEHEEMVAGLDILNDAVRRASAVFGT